MASKEQLYKASIGKWGVPSQVKLLVEECCELAVVAIKLDRRRNGSTIDQLAEEMADVEIMIEQFCYYLKLREVVDEWKDKKLRRLAHLLEESCQDRE